MPPTPEGLIHEVDAARLVSMHERLQSVFATNLASGRERISVDGRTMQVELPSPSRLAFVRLSEDIVRGQTVAKYSVSGFDGTTWVDLSSGSTIGYAKIDRVGSTSTIQRLKVTVADAIAGPVSVRISAYASS